MPMCEHNNDHKTYFRLLHRANLTITTYALIVWEEVEI
jgi:hypothetical protein